MKCLIWYWGRRGGGAKYSLEMAKALAGREGIEVHLSISKQSDLYNEFHSLGLPGFDVTTYGSVFGFCWRTLAIPKLRAIFSEYIRINKIDIVFGTMLHLWSPFFNSIIHKSGAQYLLAVHDAYCHPGDYDVLKEYLLRTGIAGADGVIALTNNVRNQLIQGRHFDPEQLWVVPHGVFAYYHANYPRSLPENRPARILFYGRILEYKGLDILLKALSIVKEKYPDIELEIWGAGDLLPYRKLLDSITGIKVENRWINENEISSIFEQCDICVLPYKEASQSGVAAIAFAAGMPVVITPQPGLIEQLSNGGGIVAEAVTSEALASALFKLLDDSIKYTEISAEAINVAIQILNWNLIADKTELAMRALSSLKLI